MMGLPQVSATMISDEVAAASLAAFMQTPTRYAGLSGCENQGSMGLSCSSLGGSKSCVEFTDDLGFLKLSSQDGNGWQIGRSAHNACTSVPRIVGFEPKASTSLVNKGDEDQPNVSHTATPVHTEGKRLLRKRFLSPLNGMLVHDPFIGDSIDIGDSIAARNSRNPIDNSSIRVVQEKKRANFGDSNYHTDVNLPGPVVLPGSNSPDDNSEVCFKHFTDGPLLEEKEPFSHKLCLPPSVDHCAQETTKLKATTISMQGSNRNVTSPSLSFSPLRPKLHDRFKNRSMGKNVRRDLINDYFADDYMGRSLEGTKLGMLYSAFEHEQISKSMGNLDFPWEKTDFFATEVTSEKPDDCIQDVDLTPKCSKPGKLRRRVHIRRSLVGSFEESLLTGHLLSAKNRKKIDGFLAVLNVTGGNFSPKSQKLPFTVTSVDGDNYLLYYSSIDLTQNTSSVGCKGPRIRRSLSSDESRTERGRLHVPMKGRIQLTFLRQKITLSSSCECNEGGEMKKDINPQTPKKQSDQCSGKESKVSDASSKVNENTLRSRVLRYALHLRFLCPFPKKNARLHRSNSEVSATPLSNDLDLGGERRFYLYNDLKVVFPQRQSDSDEGKLHVEYNYPSDPTYFEMSY
uniref:Atos-like conserved domain-containing protein n=1 Tax=Kalanchoe fedtschenkoi TaxID=63787 RepID=A0A7N0UH56_KALFE